MVTSPVVVNPANVGESPTCSPLSTFVATPLLVSVMVPCSPLERTEALTIPLGNCSLPLIIPIPKFCMDEVVTEVMPVS